MTQDPIQHNVERFSGLSVVYDSSRPKPPSILLEMLPRMVFHKEQEPDVVVDLGCGTGLSTLFWNNHAKKVIGVEPNHEMIAVAKGNLSKLNTHTTFEFMEDISSNTGLPDNSVDIVTCSQSLHWMEPDSTFREVTRILKPGGVFAAYDVSWPPTLIDWRAEMAYKTFTKFGKSEGTKKGLYKNIKKWKKGQHLERMQASQLFSWCKEVVVHNQESGNADRLIGLALSQGHINTVIKAGISTDDLKLPEFKEEVIKYLGHEQSPWLWSYRVRLAIK